VVPAGFDQPGTGSNCVGRVEVGDAHRHRLEGAGERGEPFASKRSPSLASLWI
jgi:hypothetical protein